MSEKIFSENANFYGKALYDRYATNGIIDMRQDCNMKGERLIVIGITDHAEQMPRDAEFICNTREKVTCIIDELIRLRDMVFPE